MELENNYKKIFGHVLQLEEEPVKDMAQHAAAVKKNFDPGKKVHTTHDQIKVVDEVIESNSDSDSDSDYDEDDYTPRMINREDSDSSNSGSEVDPDESQDDVLVVDVNDIKEENILAFVEITWYETKPHMIMSHNGVTITTPRWIPRG